MANYAIHNGNNLIIPDSNKVELGNGLAVAEQRGKKDMMWGYCIMGNYEGKHVLYPVYAADSLNGDFVENVVHYHIVKDEDIIMSRLS